MYVWFKVKMFLSHFFIVINEVSPGIICCDLDPSCVCGGGNNHLYSTF